jgi:transcriptional regulator with XRE-family HTH domain
MTPKAFNKALGAVIRSERKARGMRLEDLAAMLGFSYQQLCKYETGQNGCSAHLITRLAKSFQMSPADLYDRAGANPAKSQPGENDGFLAARYVARIKNEKLRRDFVDFARKLAYDGAGA